MARMWIFPPAVQTALVKETLTIAPLNISKKYRFVCNIILCEQNQISN